MNVTANDNKEYARTLGEWLDTLVLNGSSGRRAVFVERSLKRQYHKMIQNALKMNLNNVPMSWRQRMAVRAAAENGYSINLDSWMQQTLWNITVEISRKFKTNIPSELIFRKTLTSI